VTHRGVFLQIETRHAAAYGDSGEDEAKGQRMRQVERLTALRLYRAEERRETRIA
jgi:hypothetical protein